jgi:tape measure domain-containing protein
MALGAGKATAAVAALGVAVAAYGAISFGRSAADRIEETEASVFALEKLTHNGTQAFREMRDMAKDLGLDIDGTAHSYANFLKLQFPQREAKKLMALGADMQALGNSADDVQGIFRALGQIKSKGRVQAEEVLQLAERGVSQSLLYGAIAENRGLESGQRGTDQVRALQQQGKITADEFMIAFEKAINKKLGQSEAGESARDFVKSTFRGARGAAEAEVTDLWIEASTAAQPGLKKGLESFTEMIQTMSSDENMGRLIDVMEGVGEAFAATGEILGYLVPAAVEAAHVFGESFAAGYGALGDEAEGANGAINSTKELIDAMIPVARDLGYIFGHIARAMVFIADNAGDLAKVGKLVLNPLGALTSGDDGGVPDLLDSMANLAGFESGKKAAGTPSSIDDDSLAASRAVEVERNVQHGKDWGNGFIRGVQSTTPDVYSAAGTLANSAESGARDMSETHSPSRVAERIGEDWVAGFNNPLLDAKPTMALPTMAGKGNVGAVGGTGGITIGDITIEVSGSGDAEQTAQATLRAFERNLGSTLSRVAMEAGAL